MVKRILLLVIAILAGLLVVITTAVWIQETHDEADLGPFHMTVRVSELEENSSDNTTMDAFFWVATAAGESLPRWADIEVVASVGDVNTTLEPPVLEILDMDGDGLVSEYDLLRIYGLDSSFLGGTVTLLERGATIGTVEIDHEQS